MEIYKITVKYRCCDTGQKRKQTTHHKNQPMPRDLERELWERLDMEFDLEMDAEEYERWRRSLKIKTKRIRLQD